MIKRLLVALLSVIMACSCVVSVSAKDKTDVDEALYSKNLLEYLKIIYPQNDFAYETAITRADFAVYAARAMGIDDSVTDRKTRYYIDMAEYDYASYAVNQMVERGILSVDDSRMFRPADVITYQEAMKVIVSSLGYNSYAELQGGYPTGYMNIAKQLKLDKNVSSDDVFTLNDAIILISNALFTKVYSIDSVSGGIFTYETSDNTLLKNVFGLEYVKDILTGYDNINTQTFATADNDCATIGDKVYGADKYDGIDLKDYIGRTVCVLYDDYDDIKYAFPTDGKEEVMEIAVSDFINFDGDEIKYYSENNKVKSEDVSAAKILYNGSAPESGLSQLLNNVESGTVKFIDMDSNGKNDVVIVTDYKAYVTKSIDVKNEIIYSKIDGQEAILLQAYKRVLIYDEVGNQIGLSSIQKGSVLNIAASSDKSRIEIKVSPAGASGVVKGIGPDDDTCEIELDTGKFKVNKRHTDILQAISIGAEVEVLFNLEGEIVYVNNSGSAGFEVGYLIGVYPKEGGLGFDDGVRLRVYTKAGGMQFYDCDSKINVDGNKKSGKEIVNALPGCSCDNNTADVETQLILFTLNDADKIIKIDTYEPGLENPDTTLSRVKTGIDMLNGSRLGVKYPINSATQYLIVPKEENMTTDEMNFSFVKKSALYGHLDYTIDAYKLKDENDYLDVVVVRWDTDSDKSHGYLLLHPIMVDKVIKAVDAEGQMYYLVTGLLQGNKVELPVYEDDLVDTSCKVTELNEGDIVRYRTAPNGRIIEFNRLYDCKNDERPNWATDNLFVRGVTDRYYISYGYVYKTGEKVVCWGYNPGDYDEAMDISSVKCMIYDKSQPKGFRLYTGTIDDIVGYDKAGSSCDRIFVRTSEGGLSFVMVYKNMN